MRALATILLVVAALAPSIAAAHGGRPQSQAILFAPDDPARIVVPATFGTLTSTDGGASWEWTCQEAIPDASPGVVQPSVLAAGDRLIVAGTFGLLRASRAGCGWERDPVLDDRYVADVVRDGATILAVTGDSGAEDNTLYESTDEGVTFQAIGGPLPIGILSERVRVAPSDPMRVYVSGQAFVPGTAMVRGVLLRSDDRGQRWEELPIELVAGDRLVRIALVDPIDPDVAWVVVQGMEHDRVLRIGAAGAQVDEVLRLLADPMPFHRPFAIARTDDGTLWVGNTREGLHTIAPDGTVDLVDKYLGVACATVRDGALWLCGDGGDDGFTIGRQTLGAPYAPEPVARFGDIERRTCDSVVDCRCAAWWDDFRGETTLDGGFDGGGGLDGGTCVDPLDAGVGDGAIDVDASGTRPGGGGCGCGVGAGRGAAPVAAIAIALWCARWRRGRRRSS